MFVLDNPKAKEPTFIFFQMYIQGSRCRRSTGEKVHPDVWKDIKDLKGRDHTTARLIKIRDFVNQVKIDSKYTGRHLTGEMVTEYINSLVGRAEKVSNKINFKKGSNIIIQEMKNGELLTNRKKKFSPGTIKNYEQALNILVDFGLNNYETITIETYRAFLTHCNNRDKDSGWSLNYVGQNIKIWICLMKESRRRGWHNNSVHEHHEFKKPTEETIDIAFDDAEIEKLCNFEIPAKNKDRWLKVRDWFIIDCYTGLRISDLRRLTKLNLSNNTITIANEKTDATVIIPIHPRVKEILTRRNGLPPATVDQEINRVIKNICKEAKFNDKILYSYTKSGKREDIMYEKWEMVSNHTARRSFITNLRANGVPNSVIKKLTGIVKDATLERYDKMTTAQAAKIAAAHPYFTPPSAAKEASGQES